MNLNCFFQHLVDVADLPGSSIVYIYLISDLKLLPIAFHTNLLTVHRPLIQVELHFHHVNVPVFQQVIGLVHQRPFVISLLIHAFNP